MVLRQLISAACLLAASAAAVLLVEALAPAQDPFAVPTPKAGAPAAGGAPPAADPFGGAAPAGGTAPAGGAQAAAPVAPSVSPAGPEPLAIQVLRESKLTTPSELLQAAQTTLQLGRPDESKRYLGLLLAAKPADDALAALASPFADLLFQLARTKELQPEGKQVSNDILAAARRVAQNLDRINALIPQLSAESLGDRQDALGKLAQGGSAIVTPLLRVLADPARENEHRYIRAALAHLAVDTESPLVGALETPNEYLKMQVIAVL